MARILTEEQELFAQSVRDFCKKKSGTPEQRRVLTDDGKLNHSPTFYQEAADMGFIGISIPEDFGGSGASIIEECLMLQEMARGHAPIAGVIPTLIVAGAYEKFGTDEQKATNLTEMASGVTHSIAMSEPDAGSDVAAMSCKATKQGDGWVINGQKTWISNIQFTKKTLVIVRTSTGEKKHQGLTMFEVPNNAEGLEIREIPTMGEREINDMFFTDCYVPDSAVIGEVDNGWKQLMAGLEHERLKISAQLLGFAQRSLDRLMAFAEQRKQFGSTIDSFQVVRHRIADMATEIEAAEAFLYTLATQMMVNADKKLATESSMAKLKCTEVAKHVALECMQLMGAPGFAKEYEMEKDVKTALSATIYGGTNEIQREVIAKNLIGGTK